MFSCCSLSQSDIYKKKSFICLFSVKAKYNETETALLIFLNDLYKRKNLSCLWLIKIYILSLALKLLFLFIPEVRKCICYSNKTVNMALKYVLKNKNTVWININKDLNFFCIAIPAVNFHIYFTLFCCTMFCDCFIHTIFLLPKHRDCCVR